MEFGLEDCKLLAPTLGIAETKVTQGLWDAFCKLALVSITHPVINERQEGVIWQRRRRQRREEIPEE